MDIFKNVQNWKAQKSLENASFFTFAPLWSEFYFEGCKFCDDKNIFTKYYKYVNINYIKINYSNLYKIFITIDNYYNKYNNNNSINKTELELVYNSSYILKDSERKELSDLLDRILKIEYNKAFFYARN